MSLHTMPLQRNNLVIHVTAHSMVLETIQYTVATIRISGIEETLNRLPLHPQTTEVSLTNMLMNKLPVIRNYQHPIWMPYRI